MKNAYSQYWSPYISYETSKENLSKYQDILSSVISSIISVFTKELKFANFLLNTLVGM